MPPEYVRPYVKAQKNDDRDAEAIAEAATRPTMRFVPLKAEGQLDMQALHRARDRLVAERTALIPQLRALLLERGIVLPQRRRTLCCRGWTRPVDAGEPDPRRPTAAGARRRTCVQSGLSWTGASACSMTSSPPAPALTTLHGKWQRSPASVRSMRPRWSRRSATRAPSARARDLAAWLGLVPKQATTGGKPKLLGITKRGSRYLRKNLIHGARAVMPRLAATDTRLGHWLRGLLARAHKNTAVVALANKLARIVWAVLARGRTYEAAAAAS